MGLMETIARLFGVSSSTGPRGEVARNVGENGHAAPGAPPPVSRPAPASPVAVDLHTDDDDDDVLAEFGQDERGRPGVDPPDSDGAMGLVEVRGPAAGATPRNRQELVNELRKNYTEVLGLVRKVDGHLDEQSIRSQRLLDLAESSARHLESLPEIAEQNRRVADALNDLIELTRDARTRSELATERLTKTAVQQLESAQRQTAALQSMQASLHRSGEAEDRMAASISEFNTTLSDMSASTRDLGDTIASMRETDAEREAELARLVASSQRWLVAAVIACGVLLVGALALVLNNVI